MYAKIITMKGKIIVRIVAIMDKVKRIQELRRSNAATPLKNKKKYNRKQKHKLRDL
jgi:antitoxin (DNA-binding transcriptional repressor) of toxin-antitoxin stability system